MCRTIAFVFVVLSGMSSAVRAQSWQPLFDGLTLDGWVTQGDSTVNSAGWEVSGGTLHLDRSKGAGGNLLTNRDYGDFELVFEWKVSPKANNGIKYRVKQFDNSTLGLEYQVIDDFGNPELAPDHKTASLYDIYDAKEHSWLKPANEFNRGRIVVHNNRIEHWLNGHLIIAADVGSDEWNERIADSKFANVDGFGINQFGRIMLTDHSDEVWYRNIFIRELSHAVGVRTQQVSVNASSRCCCPESTKRRRFAPRYFRR